MFAETSTVYFSLLILFINVTVTHLVPPPWAGNRRKYFPSVFEAEISFGADAEINIGSYVPQRFKPGRGPPPHARKPWKRRGRPSDDSVYMRENPYDVVEVTHARPNPAVNPHTNNYVPNVPNVPSVPNVPASNNIENICGITHNSRIVGGVIAHPNKWTWMAALIKTDEKESYCGGSLITTRHVLTAAHCVNNLSPKDMIVRLGSYDFSDNVDASAEDINVLSFHIHPEFDKYSYLNDIAIIVLEKEASFSEFVRPICLPPQRRQFFGQLATVIGWGYQSYASGEKSNKLREVTVPIWNNTECNNAYTRDFENKALCAGYVEGGKDSCQGDSGGPLMVQTARRKWCIVGIVSFGKNCGEPGYPGVYTRVSQYRSWIERTIRETEEVEN